MSHEDGEQSEAEGQAGGQEGGIGEEAGEGVEVVVGERGDVVSEIIDEACAHDRGGEQGEGEQEDVDPNPAGQAPGGSVRQSGRTVRRHGEPLLESLQFFARLEADGFAGGDGHLGAGARVPSDARFAGANVEDAEAAEFDAFAGAERPFHAFEDRLDGHLGFRLGDAGFIDDFVDDIEFNQVFLPCAVAPKVARCPQPDDMIGFNHLSNRWMEGEAKPLDGREFRRCCGQFATGVAVACVIGLDGAPHGLTVNSFTSVSLEPPLILICVGHDSTILELFHTRGRFGLSFLRAEQRDLSNRFAMRGQDRFQGVDWHEGHGGVPLLDASLADMECEVEQAVRAGDHDVLIARVSSAAVHGGIPLLYFNSAYANLRD